MKGLTIMDVKEAMKQEVSWPDVYFDPRYGQAEEAAGRGKWRCVVGGHGEWLLPFHTKSDDLAQDGASPYGYSGAYAAQTLSENSRQYYWTSTLEALRELGVTSLFLRQTPLLSGPFSQPPGPTIISLHETFSVRLDGADVMWKRLQGRARTSIRKALREGFVASVRIAAAEDLYPRSPFRRMYRSTMERRAANPYYFFSDKYFTELKTGLGDRLLIADVTDAHGSVVASALFLESAPFLHYHLSASRPDAMRSGVTNLLIWQVAQHGAQVGMQLLHLGGGIVNGDGLARFKRSFGGATLHYNAYGVVVNQEAFARAMATCRTIDSPVEQAPYFPPYRRP